MFSRHRGGKTRESRVTCDALRGRRAWLMAKALCHHQHPSSRTIPAQRVAQPDNRAVGIASGIGINPRCVARDETQRTEARALRSAKGARMLSVLSKFSVRMHERH